MKRGLPVLNEPAGSVRHDGTRNFVHPADVRGRFTRARRIVFAVLMLVYLALPFVQIEGRPAVFLDVVRRRFYLFGASFNAQDFWLVLFLLTGLALGLVVVTTLYGRVWCGYACPHSVFLEGVFRPIERWLEGPRAERMKRNAGPWTWSRFARKLVKHLLYIAISALIAHVFLSYFVSLPSLLAMVSGSPTHHLTAFIWMLAMTGAMYFNFAWFREQLCLIVCPYGRLQAAMTDEQTLVVGYDTVRGEPRGKLRAAEGDCVDCGRCVVVCPTGIDIRNGLQMECVGCAACVDACDEVMRKVGRPEGLIRYDNSDGLAHRPATKQRARLWLYGAVGLVWLVVMSLSFASRGSFEAHILRPAGGAPFVVDGERVRNTLRVHIVNKDDEARTFSLDPSLSDVEMIVPVSTVTLEAGGSRDVILIANGTLGTGGTVRVRVTSDGETRVLEAPFLTSGGR